MTYLPVGRMYLKEMTEIRKFKDILLSSVMDVNHVSTTQAYFFNVCVYTIGLFFRRLPGTAKYLRFLGLIRSSCRVF